MREEQKLEVLRALAFNGIDTARTIANVKTYQLVDYPDVWGNAEDGWQVNNVSRTEEFISMTEDTTDEEIFEYLRDTIGYFAKDTKFEEVNFQWNDDFICEFFNNENECPLGRLEFERR